MLRFLPASAVQVEVYSCWTISLAAWNSVASVEAGRLGSVVGPVPARNQESERLDPSPRLLGQLATPHHRGMITDARSEALQHTP